MALNSHLDRSFDIMEDWKGIWEKPLEFISLKGCRACPDERYPK
jgi:hypothetical protein